MVQQTPLARDVLIELDDITARLTQELNDPIEARRLAIASLKNKYSEKEGFSDVNKQE